MPNAFAHIELTTTDLPAAKKFYAKVFAWKITDVPKMPYAMIDVGTGVGGGMQPKPMPEAPTGWMPYVEVANVEETIKKAAKAGATILLPFQDIGEMGTIGVFADPHGSVIGVWAPGKKPSEAEIVEKAVKNVVEKVEKATKKAASIAKKVVKKATKKAASIAKSATKETKPAPAKKAVKKVAKAPAKKAATTKPKKR